MICVFRGYSANEQQNFEGEIYDEENKKVSNLGSRHTAELTCPDAAIT
jgi:hypothetical protein